MKHVKENLVAVPLTGARLALTVDPHDRQALAKALYRALTDENIRKQCRIQATAVAKQFSASTMIEQTIAVYEQAAALHANRSRSWSFALK